MIELVLCALTVMAADDAVTKTMELGPVRVTTRLSPKEPVIGDEITFEIQVNAQADVEVLMPEFGEALSRYTILEFVPKQHVADDGTTVHTQRYTLQPTQSGAQSIPPILVEFIDRRPGQKPSPDDLDAYEVLTERIDFTVQSALPANASGDLNPPLGTLELPQPRTDRPWGWIVAISVLVSGVVVAAIVMGSARRRRVRRQNAYEIARARLDQLLARATPRTAEEREAFFVEISAVIRRYLEDRYELRAPELTTEEFLGVAGNSRTLTESHQRLLRDFLRQADLVKFAGVAADEKDIRTSSDLAIQFLEETRENAPMIEVSETDQGTSSARPLRDSQELDHD
jgi:hypothetical protein